jgi:hypothetical protein
MIHAQREDFDDRDPFLLCLLGGIGLTRHLIAATVDAGPATGPPPHESRAGERLLDALVGLYAITLAAGGEVARRVPGSTHSPAAGRPAAPRARGSLLV